MALNTASNFQELQDEVLFNSFGERYRTAAARALNQGVNEVGRRLGALPAAGVFAYTSSGTVTTTLTWTRIDHVFLSAGPVASTANAVRLQAIRELPLLAAEDTGVSLGDSADVAAWEPVRSSGGVVGVQLWPVTAAGFVGLIGLATPALMSNNTDLSGLGFEYDHALVAYARMVLFRKEDDFQAAAGWQAEFERLLATASLGRSTSRQSKQTPGDELYV